MTQSTAEFYHASRTTLEIGTVLESRFIKYLWQWETVESALDEPDAVIRKAVLKSMLLADRYMGKGKKAPLVFVLKEVILERIRQAEFPDRLSRLKSIFVCPSKSDIASFQGIVRDRPHLYLCSIADHSSLFEADMAYVGIANPLAPITKQLEYLIECARFYWQGNKSNEPVLEILAPIGSVKIAASTDS